MFLDAWWFNNRQDPACIRQPEFFTPKTHIGLYAELDRIEYPIEIDVSIDDSDSCRFKNCYRIEQGEPQTETYRLKADVAAGVLEFWAPSDTLSENPARIYVAIKTGGKAYSAEIA